MTLKKIKWLLAPIFLALLIFVLLQLDRENLLESIAHLPIWLFLLLLFLQVVTQFLVNLQWYKIAKFTKTKISFWTMFKINCKGAVVDAITPGVKFGGEVARAVLLARSANLSMEKSAAVVALQKLFSLTSLFAIAILSLAYITATTTFLQNLAVKVMIFTILIFLLTLLLSVFLFPHKLLKLLKSRNRPKRKFFKKIFNFFVLLLAQSENLQNDRPMQVKLILLSLAIWILYPLKLYLLVVWFYPQVNPFFVVVATFAAYIVAMIPIFPGGVGGFEGIMSSLLMFAGLTASTAAVVTVVFRFATFWFTLLFSSVIIGVAHLKKRIKYD